MVANAKPPIVVERVQTGVRMEKRLLKVLKGLAELKDLTLGEIEKLRNIYGLTLRAADSHQLKEQQR